MATASGRARSARAALISTLAIGVLALTAGVVSAAPPAPFSVDQPTLTFPDTVVSTTSNQTVTVTAAKNKSAVMWLEFGQGEYSSGGGTCVSAYTMQLPAGSSCTLVFTFNPFTSGAKTGSVTIWNCATWFDFGGLPKCDRNHGSTTITFSGTATDS